MENNRVKLITIIQKWSSGKLPIGTKFELEGTDKVIVLTARKEEYLPALKKFLAENNIRYDYLLGDMPPGERILVNDRKISGLDMAFAVNKNRDDKFDIKYEINGNL